MKCADYAVWQYRSREMPGRPNPISEAESKGAVCISLIDCRFHEAEGVLNQATSFSIRSLV
ncbi:hypothetical protein [Candidatus Thiosymbion oneisti]|uniref:hypothetical protein n=1 Tax=Candidatus Thiosymbion oneisti TaxID=589554 RepID=UPI00106111A6|nr:hypothetical protein [Candidatus Thiosymbion oneisti]